MAQALTEEVKLFIIQSLACYNSPSQVVELVNEEYGLELARPHVQMYDPTKYAGKSLSNKFVEVFHNTRKAFLEEVTSIPIANQAYRVYELQRLYTRALNADKDGLAKNILEQASKEMGGMFTNRVRLSADGADPFSEMLKTFVGGSMPIVHDVEFTEVKEPVKQVESKPKKTWSKKT